MPPLIPTSSRVLVGARSHGCSGTDDQACGRSGRLSQEQESPRPGPRLSVARATLCHQVEQGGGVAAAATWRLQRGQGGRVGTGLEVVPIEPVASCQSVSVDGHAIRDPACEGSQQPTTAGPKANGGSGRREHLGAQLLHRHAARFTRRPVRRACSAANAIRWLWTVDSMPASNGAPGGLVISS